MDSQNYYRIAKPATLLETKRTIKFLSIPHSKAINLQILKSARPPVIKAICNAAYNLEQNPNLPLNPKAKAFFRAHKGRISQLTNPKLSVAKKRKILQTGGSPFLIALLPAILSTAISFLGSTFLNSSRKVS